MPLHTALAGEALDARGQLERRNIVEQIDAARRRQRLHGVEIELHLTDRVVAVDKGELDRRQTRRSDTAGDIARRFAERGRDLQPFFRGDAIGEVDALSGVAVEAGVDRQHLRFRVGERNG